MARMRTGEQQAGAADYPAAGRRSGGIHREHR